MFRIEQNRIESLSRCTHTEVQYNEINYAHIPTDQGAVYIN